MLRQIYKKYNTMIMCCKPADTLFCLFSCAKRWCVKQADDLDNVPPLTLFSTAAPPHPGWRLRSVDLYRLNVDRRLERPTHKSVCTCCVGAKKPRTWTMSVRFDLLESADTTAENQEWSVVNHQFFVLFCFLVAKTKVWIFFVLFFF